MTTVRAHFDGEVFVPEEPVEMPVGEQLVLHVERPVSVKGRIRSEVIRDRLERLKKSFGTIKSSHALPPEALDRSTIYPDRL